MTAQQATRRAFLTQSAAALTSVSAAGLGLKSAHAEDVEADARLIEMGLEFDRLSAELQVADDEELRLATIYHDNKIEMPDALTCRNNDHWIGIPGLGTARRPDGRRYYSGQAVADMRNQKITKSVVDLDGPSYTRVVPNPVGQARADEIVAAWDSWIASGDALRSTLGLDVAQERSAELLGNAISLSEKILAMTATTAPGLSAQVRVVSRWCPPEDEPDEDMAQAFIACVARFSKASAGAAS